MHITHRQYHRYRNRVLVAIALLAFATLFVGFHHIGAPGNIPADQYDRVPLQNTPIPEPSTYGLLGALTVVTIVTSRRLRNRK